MLTARVITRTTTNDQEVLRASTQTKVESIYKVFVVMQYYSLDFISYEF